MREEEVGYDLHDVAPSRSLDHTHTHTHTHSREREKVRVIASTASSLPLE
jgi:hypothetical protein